MNMKPMLHMVYDVLISGKVCYCTVVQERTRSGNVLVFNHQTGSVMPIIAQRLRSSVRWPMPRTSIVI